MRVLTEVVRLVLVDVNRLVVQVRLVEVEVVSKVVVNVDDDVD